MQVGKCLLASSIMLSAAVFSMSVAAAALLDARTESAIAEVCGRVGEEVRALHISLPGGLRYRRRLLCALAVCASVLTEGPPLPQNDVLSEGERAAALQGASVAALAVGVLAAGAVSAPGSFDGATWLTALYSRRATASALAFFPGALLVVLCVPLLAANAVALGRQASCSSTSYAPVS